MSLGSLNFSASLLQDSFAVILPELLIVAVMTTSFLVSGSKLNDAELASPMVPLSVSKVKKQFSAKPFPVFTASRVAVNVFGFASSSRVISEGSTLKAEILMSGFFSTGVVVPESTGTAGLSSGFGSFGLGEVLSTGGAVTDDGLLTPGETVLLKLL